MLNLFKINIMLITVITFLVCGGVGSLCLPANAEEETSILSYTKNDHSLDLKIKSSLKAQYTRIKSSSYHLAGAKNSPSTLFHSSTNLQQKNVDEASRLKTDGKYLYFHKMNSTEINIRQVGKNTTSLVSQLTVDAMNNNLLSGLYLLENSANLIAIAGYNRLNTTIWEHWFEPSFWQNRKTELFSIGVSTPSSPKQLTKLSIDGQLISSRRIDNTLYIATRHVPYITGLEDYPSNKHQIAKNQQLIEASSLSNLLPHYQINDQATQPLFNAEECLVTKNTASDNQKSSSIISLLAINLDKIQVKPVGQCFVGNTETFYASNEAIYLATTEYHYSHKENGFVYDEQATTDIHKFSLADSAPRYVASGTITGHLGWQQDLKPFRMSEHEGVLRVISYMGASNNNEHSPARLYTLAENTTKKTLEILAQLPNESRPEPLGKVGEQIYASRFIGKRGYLVTFHVTDPLYILDLSNPSDPFIVSTLEMNGYSDYLHPIGKNYLLGIGKNAITGINEGDGRGAWYQGIKLSLIDITNPANPVEKQIMHIGQRGTETAISHTHHAFTSVLKGDILHVAIPVSLHNSVDERLEQDVNEPWFDYQWTRNELHRLSINTIKGEILALPPVVANTINPDPTYSWSAPYDRSVIIGESVYYLHEDSVMTSSL